MGVARGGPIAWGREVSILDRVFVGKVIKDFGVITEKNLAIGKQKITLLLVERHGTVKLVFKSSAWAFLGGSVQYVEVPEEAIPRLQQWINEAQELIASGARQ